MSSPFPIKSEKYAIGRIENILFELKIYNTTDEQGTSRIFHFLDVSWRNTNQPFYQGLNLTSYNPNLSLWIQKLKKTIITGSTTKIPIYEPDAPSTPAGFLLITRKTITLKTSAKDSLVGTLHIQSKNVKELLSKLQEWEIYLSVLL